MISWSYRVSISSTWEKGIDLEANTCFATVSEIVVGPSSKKQFLTVLILWFGTFLVALDTSIIGKFVAETEVHMIDL